MNRRRFLKWTARTAALSCAISPEEHALIAHSQSSEPRTAPHPGTGELQLGSLGPLKVSRLICGGNLISGFAHSRDLIYVSPLLKAYFTDEKVLQTLAKCEASGINTAILRVDDDTIRLINRYRRETGGKIQWIAQVKATENNPTSDAQRAIDNGAVAVFLHGGICDSWVADGKLDHIGRVIEFIKQNGLPAGVAAHDIAVPMACEKARLNPDFYMKTFNAKNYWSAALMPRHDSVWEETPDQTRTFMATVRKPWIAYKVLAAGAIHPREGFTYAFQNGADFICVGMFDFQIDEDVALAREAIMAAINRPRPWYG